MNAALVVITMCVLLAVSPPASAQVPQPARAQDLDALKQRLTDLERSLTDQIATLRQQIAAIEAPSPGGAAAATVPPPAGQATAGQETFSRDRETVAQVDNKPLDPAYLGFVSIPGTPARVKVDGYAKLDTIIDSHPAGNTDRFIPSTIPVGLTDAQRSPSTTMHVRQTRVNLDFRGPTELGVDFRTFAEIDFFGASGPIDPRMRHFFGQLANVLVGQTWTTFIDVDAYPDSLDDDGSSVAVKLRQPQVRYTQPLGPGQSLAFAMERPETQARQITSTGAAYSPAPDAIVRYRFDGSRGHIQAASLIRALGYRVSERRTTTLGLGGNLAGQMKVGSADALAGSMVFGKGIARYVENLVGTNSDLDLDDAGTDVTALPAFGGFLSYLHRWPHRLRSTGVFGYTNVDTTDAQPGTSFLDSYYVLGNLLWNPVGSLDVGVEYLLGTHKVVSGDDAHANRVQISAKYDFFRKRALTP
jgi:hypothetical protein